VLKELARVAFGDLREVFDERGRLLDISSLPEDTAARISSVKVQTKVLPTKDGEPADVEYTIEIKQWDKMIALTTLAKHLNLLGDNNDGNKTVTIKVQGGLPKRGKNEPT
jgi:phage terminase small subunit